ncbi:MAG: ribose 5-phosphate isomerase B [Micavibrio sp.]
MTFRLGITSDHGGFALKEFLKKNFNAVPVEWVDFGTDSENSVDYPDFGKKLADAVASGELALGVAICGTGIGISIACNRNPAIRAALCADTTMARLAREHNDAQILCLGGRVTGAETALDILKTFLESPFEGGRHQRRIDKLGSC